MLRGGPAGATVFTFSMNASEPRTINYLGTYFTQAVERRASTQEVTNVGVRVLVVVPNSQFWRGGLRDGDVVTKVDNKRITAIAELKMRLDEVAATKPRSVAMEVKRDTQLVPLVIPW